MNTCQETTELPLALFERFKQSPFYSETANSAKRKTEKGYRKFVQGLTDEFRVVSRQATLEPDFNCVFIFDRGQEIDHLDIVLADDNQEALAMVKVYPIENPLPEDLEAVLTTATYVNPRFRGQRLTKRMLLEAHQTAKLIYSERTKPLAFFSQLAIPNTPTYQGLREKMSEMLESMDYHPLDEEAGFFMKLVN